MRSNRLPIATVLSHGFALGLAFVTAACVPKAPSLGAGDGGVPKTEPPVGGVTTCQYDDKDVTNDAPALGDKVACTAMKTCVPYVRPYTAEQDAWYRAEAQKIIKSMPSNKELANHLRGTAVDQYTDIERTAHDQSITNYADTGGIREFWFRDASRGINFAVEGVGDAYATAFPVSMARGASFDVDLEYKIAQAVGDEMIASGNTMILAPCVNILRHPLWGRAQETYGEDSFLLGRLGTAYVVGVQEYVASTAKHYAANNVENDRFNANALMDEQTLREIYGRHFEMMIQDGGIAGVMASYNRVNDVYATQNRHLLTEILRGPPDKGGFAFRGLVLSDWWAMPNHITNMPNKAYAAEALKAGLDIELGWNLNYKTLEESVADGTISQADLNAAAENVLAQKVRFKGTVPNTDKVGLKDKVYSHYTPYNRDTGRGHMIDNNNAKDEVVGMSHIELSQLAAIKSMVLLKNDNNTLPIKRANVQRIAVLGSKVTYGNLGSFTQDGGAADFTTTVRTGDAGSSRVFIDQSKSSSPFAGIKELAGSGIDVRNYNSVQAMKSDNFVPDFIVVVAGMTPLDEGEQYTFAGDRKTFDLDGKADPAKPESNGHQAELVAAAAAEGKPTALVLIGGSVITIPAFNQLKAVVMAWYPGMDGGRALGKLLFGDANFSGKLPISWPARLEDLPPYTKDAVGNADMDYYLGYRYWDKRQADEGSGAPKPQFVFGYGLSYTTFSYKNLHVPCSTADDASVVDITVDVSNDGDVAGEETVFLFTSYPNSAATRRSIKELKGFRKIALNAHQTKRVHIPLRISDLKYFKTDLPSQGNENPKTGVWVIEKGAPGTVKVMVGGSSDKLMLTDTFQVN
jgi:beta-glucosidase